MTAVRVMVSGLMLYLVCGSAQARSHLTRDEIKILSATSVAVVYMDTDKALWPHINQHSGITPLTIALAMELNQRQLDAFDARTLPYLNLLAKLALPQSVRGAVQQALASVAPLQQRPWTVVTPDPKDHSFLLEQGLKTKASVVIFIRPRLEMNDDADGIYLDTMIDIETLDATGKSLNHYANTELSTDIDVDDATLPPLAAPPRPDTRKEDVRAARLFADGAAAFMQYQPRLLAQARQQLYYYFTGKDPAPPVSSAGAAERAAGANR